MQIPYDCTQVFFATTHHAAIMPSKRPEDSSYDLYAVDTNNVTMVCQYREYQWCTGAVHRSSD